MAAGASENAQASLAAARAPRAAGPGPDREALRSAYLELLKLSLCDLAGTSTLSVGAMPDRTVMSRELRGEGRRLRAAGMDWPLHGLTMVGLARLDDLQACVEAVVADGVAGDLIEAGCWRGGASILMRAVLDSLGDGRSVVAADSFQGFPAEDGGAELSAYDFLAAPLDEVRESFARFGCEDGVELLPGFFDRTLPALSGRRWALVRLDADTYEPTRVALESLYPGLSLGGHLVLDDYGSFEGCRRAVDEFRSEHGISEPIERIDFTGARWRKQEEVTVRAPSLDTAAAAAPRAVERPRETHVPTARERELSGELAELRAQLAVAEARVGLRPWLRRRLGRPR